MLLLWVWLSAGQPAAGQWQQQTGGFESILRWVNPELGRMEKRLEEIDLEMTRLPTPRNHTWGGRFGHHSGPIAGEQEPNWAQVDLGAVHVVDSIVLAPVDLSYLGKEGEGHGFPIRFRVEIANDPEMMDAVTVVDCSRADVPNPGKYPRLWSFPPVSGRYVRFTSLKHRRDENGYFWALEEMMVLSDGINRALEGERSASSVLDLGPQWSLVRLTDGQSALGIPEDVNVASPSKGFLSGPTTNGADRKWVSVDLLEPHVITRVQLLPLESDDYEVVGGRGFPRAIVIQLATDPDFEHVVWRSGRGSFPLGYPAGCALTLKVPEVRARYVRLTATEMWMRETIYRFGLAELEVKSHGHQVARGKPVTASDLADKPTDSGWAPEYLVDGYSSRYRLISWPDYLAAMDRRRLLHVEKRDLIDRYAKAVRLGRSLILMAGVVGLILLTGGWLWAVIRSKVLRLREMSLLRKQIARDLHDDIGSNLGGIMLLSKVGASYSGDEQSREDFGLIRAAAHEASMSMRDIVWLIESGHTSLRELLAKMRESVQRILGEDGVMMTIESMPDEERTLSLLFRRHVLLAFKETLHNIQKHAAADHVRISIRAKPTALMFVAQDYGKGMDLDLSGQLGHGLGNLKRRAERLGGLVRLESSPGHGTTVTFEAPFER